MRTAGTQFSWQSTPGLGPGLGLVEDQLSPHVDLSKVSLEVAFKVTSWERTFFKNSPLPSFALSACQWIDALPINIVQYLNCRLLIFLD